MKSHRNGLIRLFLGKTKSGKSFHAQKLYKKISKVIVYDFAHCFTDGQIVDDFSLTSFMKILKQLQGRKTKKFKLIFRKPTSMLHQEALSRLSKFVFFLGQSYGVRSLPDDNLLTFIVDEADKCTTKKDDDRVRRLVQAGRHANISTWAIAQRPMNMHPDFRDNASEIYAFKLATPDSFYKTMFSTNNLDKLTNSKPHTHLFWNDEGQIELVNSRGNCEVLKKS